MAHAGRPATKLQITDAERAELKARLRVRKAPEDEKLRMRIVLGCADGESGHHDRPAFGHDGAKPSPSGGGATKRTASRV